MFEAMAAAALTVGLAACSSTGPKSDGPKKGEKLKLGISMPALNSPFFGVLVSQATAAVKAEGGRLVQTTNANRDAGQQVTDFRNLITSGANAILASVVDPTTIKPALDYAASKKVPVVIVDDKPAAGSVYAVVRADNIAMGRQAAQTLAAKLPSGGKVLEITGQLSTTNGRDRAAGFDEEMKKHPNIKIISRPGNWDGPTSANIMNTVLSSNSNIAGIYLATDTVYYEPVSAALKTRGKLASDGQKAHVPIVAVDGGAGALKAIRGGYMDATISQPVNLYAKYGVRYLTKAINRTTLEAGPTDHKSVIVKTGAYFVDELPSPTVTRQNLDDPSLWGNAK